MVLSAPLRAKTREYTIDVADLKKHFTYLDGKLFAKGKQCGSRHHTGYKWVSYCGKNLAYSRVVFAIHNDRWPNGVVDHINGDREDNRIENLRDVDERENTLNTKKVREHGHFPGVCLRKNGGRRKLWRAYAPAKFLNRDRPLKKLIKSFQTKEEAIIAVMAFCIFGEFDGLTEFNTVRSKRKNDLNIAI
jgi:hypothetical protein